MLKGTPIYAWAERIIVIGWSKQLFSTLPCLEGFGGSCHRVKYPNIWLKPSLADDIFLWAGNSAAITAVAILWSANDAQRMSSRTAMQLSIVSHCEADVATGEHSIVGNRWQLLAIVQLLIVVHPTKLSAIGTQTTMSIFTNCRLEWLSNHCPLYLVLLRAV